jgi:hypothetical protein
MTVSFDWSIKLGDVLTIITFAGLAIGAYYALRGQVTILSDRVGHMEKDLTTFVETLVTIGRQDERLNSHALRIAELEKAAPRTKRR